MHIRSFLLALLLCLLLPGVSAAQNATPQATADALQTSAYRAAALRTGPGDTYQIIGELNPGVQMRILERNAIGNWLHVARPEGSRTALDGWVMTGFLNLSPALDFGTVPVNSTLPDADLSRLDDDRLARLYAVPVIPAISPAMVEVYERGRLLQNQPTVVTKVGDSLSANPYYLETMSQDDYVLGAYGYLEPTLLTFGPSLAGGSVAARVGLSSLVVFDPTWADREQCQPGEAPLYCEYRLKHPAIAVIMFGPNDVRSMDAERYHTQMERIVQDTLALGIIPVLCTFSTHPDERFYWQSLAFNTELVALAEQYEVPLINLWSAARALPAYGLDVDQVHLLNSGFTFIKYDTGHESWYGVSLHNLLVLRTLYALQQTLGMA